MDALRGRCGTVTQLRIMNKRDIFRFGRRFIELVDRFHLFGCFCPSESGTRPNVSVDLMERERETETERQTDRQTDRLRMLNELAICPFEFVNIRGGEELQIHAI